MIRDTYHGLLEAASFAARMHEGQYRKDEKTPYVSHVFRVTLVVRDVFEVNDRQVLTAALLHDTLEDTTTDFDDLAEQFGVEVARWVSALSKDKRLEEAEREREYIRVLQTSPWQVQICKLADVFDNLMDSYRLTADQRPTTMKRVRGYIDALAAVASPQTQRALELVRQLHAELNA